MSIEKGKISSFQLLILIFTSMSGSVGIFYAGSVAGNNIWLAYIAGCSGGLIVAFLVIKLAHDYPGKNLIEIHDSIYGPIIGKAISVFYIWFFFHLGSIVLYDYSAYISTVMLTTTPQEVIVLCTLVLTAYMVRSGIEVMGRCAVALFPLIVFTLLFITITLSNEIHLEALLPIMDIPAWKFLKASFHTAVYPFGEIVVYLMILTFLNNQKKLRSSILLGMTLAAFNLMTLSLLSITVLQTLAGIFTYPVHAMIYRIDIADIITRVDILGASAGLLLGIMKIAVMYYAAALGTAQVLNLRSFTPVVLPIGLLIFDLSIIQFPDALANFMFHSGIYPFYALLFQLFLPLLTFLVSRVRKNTNGAAPIAVKNIQGNGG